MSDDSTPSPNALEPRERHVRVLRTARYFVLGEPGPDTDDLWIVAHGYGQLAARFARVFSGIADERRVIAAPEGLSRYYIDHGRAPGRTPKIGASWMTREDRLREIEDYIAYLDAVHTEIAARLTRPARLTGLGFSQGVATITRWAVRGRARVDRLILCGGTLPPELDEDGYSRLREMELVIMVGRRDELAEPGLVREQEELLERHRVAYRTIWFDGGHEVSRDVVAELARR